MVRIPCELAVLVVIEPPPRVMWPATFASTPLAPLPKVWMTTLFATMDASPRKANRPGACAPVVVTEPPVSDTVAPLCACTARPVEPLVEIRVSAAVTELPMPVAYIAEASEPVVVIVEPLKIWIVPAAVA